MFVKYFLEGIKTVIVGVIVSFFMILACAGICKAFSLSSDWVNTMNMIVKSLSIIIAVLVCFKYSTYGWLRGGVCGLVYIIISSLVFSIIAKTLCFNLAFLADIVLGVVSGVVSGVVAVNFKNVN